MENQPPSAVPTPADRAAAMAGAAAPPPSVDAIYLEHGPRMRRVAIRKFGVPPAEAEELVQDVFTSYLLAERQVRSDLRGYLIAAICNACRNYWRSRKSQDRIFIDDDSAFAAAPTDDLFGGLEVNLTVASTLAKLGARCREALKRYYLQGEATPAIAETMKTTPANVNYLMHICRKRARTIYEAITRIR